MSTHDLILETSRELFNNHGVDSASIYRIAETLSISTGNLTYHFKRKKDIISKHIAQLEQSLVAAVEDFPFEGSAKEFIAAYATMFEITWNYRFLFNCAAHLIQNDLLDSSEYDRLNEHMQGTVLGRTNYLIEQGLMTEIPEPYDVNTLVDCIWWQWLGWLEVNQLRKPEQHIPFPELLASGIKHSIFITQPYMKKRYLKKLLQELEAFQATSPQQYPLAK